MSGHSMIRNVLCMSVLLFTIAAALSSYGVVPERVYAAEDESEQAKYVQIDRFIESSIEKYGDDGSITRLR